MSRTGHPRHSALRHPVDVLAPGPFADTVEPLVTLGDRFHDWIIVAGKRCSHALEAWQRHRQVRRRAAELRGLSNAALKDIGVARCGIERMVQDSLDDPSAGRQRSAL